MSGRFLLGALAGVAAMIATPAAAGTAKRSSFGKLPDGREVAAVTLANGQGMSAVLIAYGASIQSVMLPDRSGRPADIAIGDGR